MAAASSPIEGAFLSFPELEIWAPTFTYAFQHWVSCNSRIAVMAGRLQMRVQGLVGDWHGIFCPTSIMPLAIATRVRSWIIDRWTCNLLSILPFCSCGKHNP